MHRTLKLLVLLLIVLTMIGMQGCRTYCETAYGISEYTDYPPTPERPELYDIVFDQFPDLFVVDGEWISVRHKEFYDAYVEQKEDLKAVIRIWESWRDSVYTLNPPLEE